MFSIVFGAPLEAACWHVCSACLTSYLAAKLIARRLIWGTVHAKASPATLQQVSPRYRYSIGQTAEYLSGILLLKMHCSSVGG